jgi:hypothetical protein
VEKWALKRMNDSKSGYPATCSLQRSLKEPGQMDLYWRLPRYKGDTLRISEVLALSQGAKAPLSFSLSLHHPA